MKSVVTSKSGFHFFLFYLEKFIFFFRQMAKSSRQFFLVLFTVQFVLFLIMSDIDESTSIQYSEGKLIKFSFNCYNV